MVKGKPPKVVLSSGPSSANKWLYNLKLVTSCFSIKVKATAIAGGKEKWYSHSGRQFGSFLQN